MASLGATVWPKPIALVPCLSWTSASVTFTRGQLKYKIPISSRIIVLVTDGYCIYNYFDFVDQAFCLLGAVAAIIPSL